MRPRGFYPEAQQIEIALEVGYTIPSHLARYFSGQWVSLPPSFAPS
jgi:hypothetical protein